MWRTGWNFFLDSGGRCLWQDILSCCIRYLMVSRPHFVRRLRFGHLFLPGWALPTPRFVFASVCCTFARYALSRFRWAISRIVLLCTVATCHCCLALGSYVAVFLALIALLHPALPFVSLALEDLGLPYQTLVNDLVGVLFVTPALIWKTS